MKLAFVTPRYGEEVIGGAEMAARMLAEHVVRELGWPVEVFTTTALEATTWAHHYDEGDTVIGGVTVHRVRPRAERARSFDRLSNRVLRVPERASGADQDEWVRQQGPWSPELVEEIEASDADVLAFYPYLYYPTVAGILRAGSRAVLHPAAHDEAPIRLPIYAEVFAAARGFVLQTHAERRLVEHLFPLAHRPQGMVGLGVDPAPGDEVVARAALGLGDRPYLLCLGRVDEGKGAGLLARWFATYKARRPGPLTLVYAGPVVDRPPVHPDVVVAGRVDEPTKWGLLRGARVLVSPSPHEAFSLALLEGWLARTPALVWAGCGPTVEHCQRSGGGLWFGRYSEFESAVDRLTVDDRLAGEMAARGSAYVEAHYRWPAVIGRYEAFLDRVFTP